MLTQELISLTNLSVAGGCGCKLDPETLTQLLCTYKSSESKGLLIGFDTADDCAVYEYCKDDYLLYTTDFFTPLVDDPYVYGALAAANAVSDIFAMGGKPLIANAILGFPPDKVPTSMVQKIIEGGEDILKSVGCAIVGGHTIVNPQPIYGFSIVGRVEKSHLKPNSTAQPGDLLLLTKPLGTGILSTALKLGLLSEEYYQSLLPYLLEVNRCGAPLGSLAGVHAMTDVTGFGLIGHALEMAQKNLMVELYAEHIPLHPGTLDLCSAVLAPGSGAVKNLNKYHKKTHFVGLWENDEKCLFTDPQSNGGLLIAVAPESLDEVQELIFKQNGKKAELIGCFKAQNDPSYSLAFYPKGTSFYG